MRCCPATQSPKTYLTFVSFGRRSASSGMRRESDRRAMTRQAARTCQFTTTNTLHDYSTTHYTCEYCTHANSNVTYSYEYKLNYCTVYTALHSAVIHKYWHTCKRVRNASRSAVTQTHPKTNSIEQLTTNSYRHQIGCLVKQSTPAADSDPKLIAALVCSVYTSSLCGHQSPNAQWPVWAYESLESIALLIV